MSSIQSVLLVSSLLLGQSAPSMSSLKPAPLRMAQANPNPNLPALARDQSQKMYGTLVWTTVRKSAMTRETSTHVVKGSFLRYRNTGPCYEMPSDALVDGNITFRGFEGTVEAEVVFEDLESYPDTPPEERDQMIKRSQKRAVLPVRLKEQQVRDGNYFYQYGPTERVTMGCVTLNPRTGRFWLAPPWVNNMDSWVTAGHVSAKKINQNGRELPYEPEAAAGYRFMPPLAFTEGRYDPKSESYTGSWSIIDPPTPGPDDDYVEHRLSWTLKYSEDGDVLVKGPKCACKPNEVLSYKAQTSLSGGSFEKFEVTADGKAPVILKNVGGAQAQTLLEIKGDAKTTGKTKIVAVYKDSKGKLQKSKPFEVNFCELEGEPSLVKVPTHQPTSDKAAYLYDQTSRSMLKIQAHARSVKLWLSGKPEDLSQLNWDIQPRGDASYTIENDDPMEEVTFTTMGMPRLNRDFGKKEITVTTTPSDCECQLKSDPAKLRVYFHLLKAGAKGYEDVLSNNPEGKEPNWLYYWKQTAAWVPLPAAYHYVPGKIPDLPNGVLVPVKAAAQYDQFVDEFWLSNNITVWGAPAPPGEDPSNTRWGIDAMATAIRHEMQHRDDFIAWWGPKMQRYKLFDYIKSGTGMMPWDPAAGDCDLDTVPNQIEAKEGCRNGCDVPPYPQKITKKLWETVILTHQKSCPSRPNQSLLDMELYAYHAGWKWPRGKANGEDWSYPGKQCAENTCDPAP